MKVTMNMKTKIKTNQIINTATACALACWLSTAAYGAGVYEQVLLRADWPARVNGQTVLDIEAIRDTLRNVHDDARTEVVIFYPGGDAGRQWAQVVRDWLIALGVRGDQLEMQPGAGDDARLLLSVFDRRLNSTQP